MQKKQHMKLAILPHWCKYLSLAMFAPAVAFIFSIFITGVIDGYNEQVLLHNPEADVTLLGQPPADAPFLLIGEWFALFAIIVYILSKDKYDDDFINIIRARALSIALFFSAFIVIFALFFQKQLSGTALLFINFLSYIIIFKTIKMIKLVKPA